MSDAFLRENLVGNRPGVHGEPVVMQHLPELGSSLRAQGQPHQAQHLPVAVLLDDVDALVMIDERLGFLSVNGYARRRHVGG